MRTAKGVDAGEVKNWDHHACLPQGTSVGRNISISWKVKKSLALKTRSLEL